MEDRIGQRLGNYRLTRLLGRGGFAEVYLGEHLRLGTQAAVKVLYTRLANPTEVESFEHDSSGAAYDATYIGNPGLGKPGIFGSSGDTAVQLNGDSGYVSTMNQATPLTATQGDHDRTVELWFQTSQSVGYGKNLFTTGSPGHTQSFDIALIGANGPGACGSHAGAGLYVRCWDDDLHLAGLQLADSQWHYVAVTVSRGGTMVTVVVDGQQPGGYVWNGNCWTPNPQVQPFLMPFPVNTASTPIGIGNSGWTTGINGVVDEVAIYPSALSVSELSAYYRLGRTQR